jgi:hypothetical protein
MAKLFKTYGNHSPSLSDEIVSSLNQLIVTHVISEKYTQATLLPLIEKMTLRTSQDYQALLEHLKGDSAETLYDIPDIVKIHMKSCKRHIIDSQKAVYNEIKQACNNFLCLVNNLETQVKTLKDKNSLTNKKEESLDNESTSPSITKYYLS